MNEKVHIAVFSRTGNTLAAGRRLAELLAPDAACETIRSMRLSGGILGYLRAGRAALRQHSWPIEPPDPLPEGARLLVVGTPIWAGRMAPPVRSYLKQAGLSYPAIAALVTHGGSDPARTLAGIESVTGKPIVARVAISNADRAQGAVDAKLGAFAAELRKLI